MDTKRIRFTHSDLKAEKKTRNNLHINSIKFAYKTYDQIVGIRENMKNEIQDMFEKIKPKNITIVHNINNINLIIKNSSKELVFQEDTFSNYTINEINEILNKKESKKFINIARFSKEKGLSRLIEAFKEYRNDNLDSYLFLIGGHGPEFNNVMKLIGKNKNDNIIVIRSILNPFPVLKKCDLFILSSYYEGLPITVMESLILNIPVLSVNIEGPREFLKQGYAYLTEDSKQGLVEGMKKFSNDEYGPLKRFDGEKFNERAIKEFYNILDMEK